MEKASQEALDKKTCSYKYFSILAKLTTATVSQKNPEKIIEHDNASEEAKHM
jgi:hypothetical protein